jgi:hypothetical protein
VAGMRLGVGITEPLRVAERERRGDQLIRCSPSRGVAQPG